METQIRMYTGGMVQTNSYLFQKNGAAILIDAPLGVSDWLSSLDVLPTDLLLTHQHYDHVEDAAKLAAQGVKIHAHSPYSRELTLELLLQQSGYPLEVAPYEVHNVIGKATEIEIAGLYFSVEYVPGHASDSLVFISDNVIFAGDTLFAGGIGRADLPGGDMDLLVKGILDKILIRESKSRVFPGHGPETTVGAEKAGNAFLQITKE
ncbi:MAG: MBL fold metallo-hydrolase [Akkermansiaceae bacterium]